MIRYVLFRDRVSVCLMLYDAVSKAVSLTRVEEVFSFEILGFAP